MINSIIKKIPKLFYQKPSFMILGVQKGGTTALYYFLNHHPNICKSQKEIYYFSDEYLYKKGIAWYHKTFFGSVIPPNPSKKCFDATPAYWDIEDVAEKIYNYNPNLKFIISLRDPVKRAYSAWNMYKQFHNNVPERLIEVQKRETISSDAKQIIDFFINVPNPPSFEETIDFELKNMHQISQPSVVRAGMYAEHLLRYFKYFNPNQFKIITDKELHQNTGECLNKVFDFLDLSPYQLPEDILYKKYHKRQYEESISVNMENKLRSFYKPHDIKLKNLLKRDFYWIK